MDHFLSRLGSGAYFPATVCEGGGTPTPNLNFHRHSRPDSSASDARPQQQTPHVVLDSCRPHQQHLRRHNTAPASSRSRRWPSINHESPRISVVPTSQDSSVTSLHTSPRSPKHAHVSNTDNATMMSTISSLPRSKQQPGPATVATALRGTGVFPSSVIRASREDNSNSTGPFPVIIMGAGRLGESLISFPSFAPAGINIVGLFDIDPSKVGIKMGSITVEPAHSMPTRVLQSNVLRAIIAVPPSHAQEVANALVRAGIRVILNYAPTNINVPGHVVCERVDPANQFLKLIGQPMLANNNKQDLGDTNMESSSLSRYDNDRALRDLLGLVGVPVDKNRLLTGIPPACTTRLGLLMLLPSSTDINSDVSSTTAATASFVLRSLMSAAATFGFTRVTSMHTSESGADSDSSTDAGTDTEGDIDMMGERHSPVAAAVNLLQACHGYSPKKHTSSSLSSQKQDIYMGALSFLFPSIGQKWTRETKGGGAARWHPMSIFSSSYSSSSSLSSLASEPQGNRLMLSLKNLESASSSSSLDGRGLLMSQQNTNSVGSANCFDATRMSSSSLSSMYVSSQSPWSMQRHDSNSSGDTSGVVGKASSDSDYTDELKWGDDFMGSGSGRHEFNDGDTEVGGDSQFDSGSELGDHQHLYCPTYAADVSVDVQDGRIQPEDDEAVGQHDGDVLDVDSDQHDDQTQLWRRMELLNDGSNGWSNSPQPMSNVTREQRRRRPRGASDEISSVSTSSFSDVYHLSRSVSDIVIENEHPISEPASRTRARYYSSTPQPPGMGGENELGPSMLPHSLSSPVISLASRDRSSPTMMLSGGPVSSRVMSGSPLSAPAVSSNSNNPGVNTGQPSFFCFLLSERERERFHSEMNNNHINGAQRRPTSAQGEGVIDKSSTTEPNNSNNDTVDIHNNNNNSNNNNNNNNTNTNINNNNNNMGRKRATISSLQRIPLSSGSRSGTQSPPLPTTLPHHNNKHDPVADMVCPTSSSISYGPMTNGPGRYKLTTRPNTPWSSVAGLELAKSTLRETLELASFDSNCVNGERGENLSSEVGETHAGLPWTSMLMYGPPGCGKSMLAKAVATELFDKYTFFHVPASELLTDRGSNERAFEALFQMVTAAQPAILFIDKVDLLCRRDERDRKMKSELLHQLERLQEAATQQHSGGVFVLAATAVPWELDVTVLRHFEKRVLIPLPDKNARQCILKDRVRGAQVAPDLTPAHYDALVKATEGYSADNVAKVAKRALCKPILRQRRATAAVFGKKDLNSGSHILETSESGDVGNGSIGGSNESIKYAAATVDDFTTSVREVRPALTHGIVRLYENFTERFGEADSSVMADRRKSDLEEQQRKRDGHMSMYS